MCYSVFWRLWSVGSDCWEVLEAFEVLGALEVPEVIRCVLLSMLETMHRVPEMMHRVLENDASCAGE